MKIFFTTILSVLMSLSLISQDIHFSQFTSAPLTLNPAMTGLFNGNMRLIANYRNQYASISPEDAFNTVAFSADTRFSVFDRDFAGVGISIYSDNAGAAELSTTQINVSGAYSKELTGSQYLTGGIQVGFAQRGINYQNLTFNSQFDGESFNPNLPSQENLIENNINFADLSFGLMWFMSPSEKNNVYAGVGVQHINNPDLSLIAEQTDPLYMRVTGNLGGEVELNDRFGLIPSLMYMKQGPLSQIVGGSYVKYALHDQGDAPYFQLGVMARMVNGLDGGLNSDAMIVGSRFNYQSFDIGLSYDFTVSDLKTANNGNGGFELSLIYITGWNEQRGKALCPKF